MRTNRSQALKTKEGGLDFLVNRLRKPRESEPSFHNEESAQLPIKSAKEQHKDCHGRQGRISEVLIPGNSQDYFYSPRTKKIYGFPGTTFLSPAHSKPLSKLAKCTSSSNLLGCPELSKFNKKNKECLDMTKTRASLIESHKKTLDRIQQMIFSHGVEAALKNQGSKKTVEEKPRKIAKTPRYSENLVSQNEFHLDRKQSESFGNQKKPCKESIQHHRELKQTISTNSTLKNVKQLKIGDFDVGKEVGRGRFGVVRQARHRKTGLVFAIKIIKKTTIKQEQIVMQLVKQIRIQYFLNQANIVKLYTVFDDAQNCYLLLELCCQGNLYQRLLKQHQFQQNQARAILKDICEGLAQLHENKIIHRDLKPENIVLNYGLAKICDFGWSTLNKDSLRQTFCGTPLYVSPELLCGNSYDQKVDLWSIGILCYEMLVGKIPFEIHSEKDLRKIVESKIVYPKTMSVEACSFLSELLTRDPKKRTNIISLLKHSFFQKK